MQNQVGRLQLYELVWSKRAMILARRFELSDVGFAKACRRARIPLPPRGYWAKRTGRKPVAQFPLPPHGPGMADFVQIEPPVPRSRANRATPPSGAKVEVVPPPPVLPLAIQQLLDKTCAAIGRVPIERDLSAPHPLIAKALSRNEERRQKMLINRYAWDKTILESPLEKRRLPAFAAVVPGAGAAALQALDARERRPGVVRAGRELKCEVERTQLARFLHSGIARSTM